MIRRVGLRATAFATAFAVFAGVLPGAFGAPCAIAAGREFIVPVDGPIVRSFEMPLGPYAAGHRGVDFAVPLGMEVVASASGKVTFAGPVADDGLFITIRHDDVISTTYSFMSRVDVAAGDSVKQGDPIGLSGDGHPGFGVPALHFGAKAGGVYIDPEILLFGKLDDISDLISLGPVEDEFDDFDSQAASAAAAVDWRSASFESARVPEAHEPWYVKLGGAIAGAGRTIKDATVKSAKWLKDKTVGAARWLKDKTVGAASWTKAKVLTAASWTKDKVVGAAKWVAKSAGAVRWMGAKLAALGRIAGKVGGSIGQALSTAFHWAGNLTKTFGRALWKGLLAVKRFAVGLLRGLGSVGSKILRAAGKAGRLIKLSLNRVLRLVLILKAIAVFAGGMAKGFYQQVGCWRQGGATPPVIPSRDELRNGAKPPPPPNDNIVVAVAGIGSYTAGEKGKPVPGASIYSMDFRTLGYSEDQVFYFSYKGVEDRGGSDPFRLHAPYEKEDTFKSIKASAKKLAKQIRAIHKMYPDKKIDIVAHSQGGLVAQFYATELYRRENSQGINVDHMVTIASPHQGADAAGIYNLLSDNLPGRVALTELDWTARRLGLPPPSSPSTREMGERSEFITTLNEHWDPSKVKTTTIADTFDMVVTPQHTRLKGAENYTADMPGGAWKRPLTHHGDVVESASAKEIMYNALADTPSGCTALRNAFADHGPGRIVSGVEDFMLTVMDVGTTVGSAAGFIR